MKKLITGIFVVLLIVVSVPLVVLLFTGSNTYAESYNELQSEHQTLQAQLIVYRQQLAQLEQTKEELGTDNAELTAQITALQATIKHLEGLLGNLPGGIWTDEFMQYGREYVMSTRDFFFLGQVRPDVFHLELDDGRSVFVEDRESGLHLWVGTFLLTIQPNQWLKIYTIGDSFVVHIAIPVNLHLLPPGSRPTEFMFGTVRIIPLNGVETINVTSTLTTDIVEHLPKIRGWAV